MAMTRNEIARRVLCVDDEPKVLEGLERTLEQYYEVFTAEGGEAGLHVLEEHGPFAVVVSDMRMPGMDGAAFLSAVSRKSPDTVRLLLTGQRDIESAISAVNRGNIFRFLAKPCPPDDLLRTVEAAQEQHRLLTAEHDLLANTLTGSISVLTEVLSLASPAAFSRAEQIRSIVGYLAANLGLPRRWRYEVAALLSQLGFIALPPDTLERVRSGAEISDQEMDLLNRHPEVAYRLLLRIPRLEEVAAMIRGQREPSPEDPRDIQLGSQLLRLAQALDRLLTSGSSVEEAVSRLARNQAFDPGLLELLSGFTPGGHREEMGKVLDAARGAGFDEGVLSRLPKVA
jgi:response regulator RpfG family c-di-GMP phosphodiesterase